MNNLSSYCGLVDAKIRPSDKDLSVSRVIRERSEFDKVCTYDPTEACFKGDLIQKVF